MTRSDLNGDCSYLFIIESCSSFAWCLTTCGGGWNRRSWNSLTFVIQWLSWPGSHIWYWESILYLPWRETRIQMRMCEIENLMCVAVWAVHLDAFVELGYCDFSSGFSILVFFYGLYASIVLSLYILRRLYTHTLSLSRIGDPPPTIDSSRCAILNPMLHLYFAWSNFSLAWAPGESSNILSKPPWYLQTIVQTGICCLPTRSASLVMNVSQRNADLFQCV